MFSDYMQGLRTFGPVNFARIRLDRPLRSRYLRYPVKVRRFSSDRWVFQQIFIDREYRCLDGIQRLSYVIDAGANVGYSAAYLLSKFPDAVVWGIEPDPDNYLQLVDNCAPYGGNFHPLLGAVWNERTRLCFDDRTTGAGAEWGRQVKAGDGLIEAYSVPDLIAMSGFPRISLLKMDVEGAEKEIFAADTSWLDLVDNIVIELHDDDARRIFHQAIKNRGYVVSQCDELTVCLSQ